jgi:acetyl esterase/lipase
MAPVDRRVRLWAWIVARQSIGSRSEDRIVAMQARHTPSNAVSNRIFGTTARGIAVTDRTIPVPEGELPVRVYRPDEAGPGADARPLVVYFHGGGFAFGDLRLGDWICGNVAQRVGAVVVSVEYRLAPRHRFPAAVQDGYAALVWAAEHAGELGAGGPAGVMGESAGGNLAAVMCLLARDRGGPAIGHQALLYPATDMTRAHVPDGRPARPLILSAADMTAYRRHYLGDADPADPRASPLLAADHSRLPPALIQVAEHDPLRADGVAYAAALRAAGVPVRFTEYVGMPHGYLNFPGVCRGAPQALAELCAEQSAALSRVDMPVPDSLRAPGDYARG